MSDIAIRVENISKLYRIGQQKYYKTLRETLTNTFLAPIHILKNILNRQEALSSKKQSSKYIWALKDICFEVKRGEVVGIIGRNGAGKSTLLKVLSRITEPTEGHADIFGRVGSLLEVGTGFHPELTGRENIYLNGAILGMRKKEINRKFDEIINFSGIEKFIDTPVKHYSSGMQVRLAFAVAAHLEPEILMVDEVLSVGDEAFQKKCLGKIKNVTQEGRTILLVSHNMNAIRNLCERTLLIDSGQIILDGRTDQVIARYLDRNLHKGAIVQREHLEANMEGVIRRDHPTIRFREIALIDEKGEPRNEFRSDEEIRVSITYECLTVVVGLSVALFFTDEENKSILVSEDRDASESIKFYRKEPGLYRSICILPVNLLGERRFYLTVHLENPKVEHLVINKVLGFDIKFKGYNSYHGGIKDAWIRPQLNWFTKFFPDE